jgi:leader peptidase (prepilin peptidase)/N-methyltransferase
MQDWIADAITLGCLGGAVALLIALSVIDLRVRLLPNRLVLLFALLGIIFHIATNNVYLSWSDVILGGAVGFSLLYGIRYGANKYYGQDALGLGDVKLLGAAGLWLGVDGVLTAMTLGAVIGLLHGLSVAFYQAIKTRTRPSLSRLEVPAGPGFALGIIAVGLYQFGFLTSGFVWPGH